MFEGRKIKCVRRMTEEEASEEYWDFGRHGAPIVIDLDDGTTIYPSRDPEGNDHGWLFAKNKEGEGINVLTKAELARYQQEGADS